MPSVRRVWLGTKGIKELVKQYDIMAKDIQKYTESAHDYVVERAKAEYSGRLADADGVDVEWQSTGKSYRARIYNHDINAKFVEYGTGLNGVGTFPGGNPDPEGGFKLLFGHALCVAKDCGKVKCHKSFPFHCLNVL
jgi:hypothetical protein